jgi:TPR repeat protein
MSTSSVPGAHAQRPLLQGPGSSGFFAEYLPATATAQIRQAYLDAMSILSIDAPSTLSVGTARGTSSVHLGAPVSSVHLSAPVAAIRWESGSASGSPARAGGRPLVPLPMRAMPSSPPSPALSFAGGRGGGLKGLSPPRIILTQHPRAASSTSALRAAEAGSVDGAAERPTPPPRMNDSGPPAAPAVTRQPLGGRGVMAVRGPSSMPQQQLGGLPGWPVRPAGSPGAAGPPASPAASSSLPERLRTAALVSETSPSRPARVATQPAPPAAASEAEAEGPTRRVSAASSLHSAGSGGGRVSSSSSLLASLRESIAITEALLAPPEGGSPLADPPPPGAASPMSPRDMDGGGGEGKNARPSSSVPASAKASPSGSGLGGLADLALRPLPSSFPSPAVEEGEGRVSVASSLLRSLLEGRLPASSPPRAGGGGDIPDLGAALAALAATRKGGAAPTAVGRAVSRGKASRASRGAAALAPEPAAPPPAPAAAFMAAPPARPSPAPPLRTRPSSAVHRYNPAPLLRPLTASAHRSTVSPGGGNDSPARLAFLLETLLDQGLPLDVVAAAIDASSLGGGGRRIGAGSEVTRYGVSPAPSDASRSPRSSSWSPPEPFHPLPVPGLASTGAPVFTLPVLPAELVEVSRARRERTQALADAEKAREEAREREREEEAVRQAQARAETERQRAALLALVAAASEATQAVLRPRVRAAAQIVDKSGDTGEDVDEWHSREAAARAEVMVASLEEDRRAAARAAAAAVAGPSLPVVAAVEAPTAGDAEPFPPLARWEVRLPAGNAPHLSPAPPAADGRTSAGAHWETALARAEAAAAAAAASAGGLFGLTSPRSPRSRTGGQRPPVRCASLSPAELLASEVGRVASAISFARRGESWGRSQAGKLAAAASSPVPTSLYDLEGASPELISRAAAADKAALEARTALADALRGMEERMEAERREMRAKIEATEATAAAAVASAVAEAVAETRRLAPAGVATPVSLGAPSNPVAASAPAFALVESSAVVPLPSVAAAPAIGSAAPAAVFMAVQTAVISPEERPHKTVAPAMVGLAPATAMAVPGAGMPVVSSPTAAVTLAVAAVAAVAPVSPSAVAPLPAAMVVSAVVPAAAAAALIAAAAVPLGIAATPAATAPEAAVPAMSEPKSESEASAASVRRGAATLAVPAPSASAATGGAPPATVMAVAPPAVVTSGAPITAPTATPVMVHPPALGSPASPSSDRGEEARVLAALEEAREGARVASASLAAAAAAPAASRVPSVGPVAVASTAALMAMVAAISAEAQPAVAAPRGPLFNTNAYLAGMCFKLGVEGLPLDPVRARECFEAARELPASLCALALCYRTGTGAVRNPTKAAELFREAADGGCGLAQFQYGTCCLGGIGVPRNVEAALASFRRGAANGNSSSQFALGAAYEEGTGVPIDMHTAISWYAAAASPRDAGGLTDCPDCGQMYGSACFVGFCSNSAKIGKAQEKLDALAEAHPELADAVEAAFIAAEEAVDQPRPAVPGRPTAAETLALATSLFYHGQLLTRGAGGVEKDVVKAAQCFAAAGPLPEAQCALARCYMAGRGVPLDMAKAVALFASSRACNDPLGTYGLAVCYQQGLGGLMRSPEAAISLFRTAAAAECSSAMVALAEALSDGYGVARDSSTAVTLYREAATGRSPRSVEDCPLCGVRWGRGCVVGFCPNALARDKAVAKLAGLERRALLILHTRFRAWRSLEDVVRRQLAKQRAQPATR